MTSAEDTEDLFFEFEDETDDKQLFFANDKRFLDADSQRGAGEYGNIAWDINVQRTVHHKTKKRGVNFGGSIHIADCNRVISLDLWCSSLSDLKARIKKVEEFQRSLALLREALENAKDAAVEYLTAPEETLGSDEVK